MSERIPATRRAMEEKDAEAFLARYRNEALVAPDDPGERALVERFSESHQTSLSEDDERHLEAGTSPQVVFLTSSSVKPIHEKA